MSKITGQQVADFIREGVQDKTLVIAGFGSFKKVTKAPRKARNPRTGETVDVPAKTVITFKSKSI